MSSRKWMHFRVDEYVSTYSHLCDQYNWFEIYLSIHARPPEIEALTVGFWRLPRFRYQSYEREERVKSKRVVQTLYNTSAPFY